MAGSGYNFAMFFRDVFGHIGDTQGSALGLSAQTVRQITQFKTLHNTWCEGACAYGLGTFQHRELIPFVADQRDNETMRQIMLVGHGGDGWGSTSPLAAYSQVYDFGIALTLNNNFAANNLNCSDNAPAGRYRPNINPNNGARPNATITHSMGMVCAAFDAVVRLYGHPGLVCPGPSGQTSYAAADSSEPTKAATARTLGTSRALMTGGQACPRWYHGPIPLSEICLGLCAECAPCVNVSRTSAGCDSCYHGRARPEKTPPVPTGKQGPACLPQCAEWLLATAS
jgi:hypothetical protein